MVRQSGFLALIMYLIGITLANASETYSFYAIECELEGQKQCSPLAELSVVVNPSNQSVQLNGIDFKKNERFANTLDGCRVTDAKNFSCEEPYTPGSYSYSRQYGLADGKYMTFKLIGYPAPKKSTYLIGATEYYWRKLTGRWAQ